MRGSILPAPEGGVDLPRRFAEEMGALIGPNFPSDIGLAVSGGGDSMAMLHLAALWARVMGVKLWVATVDHGLRAEHSLEHLAICHAVFLGLPVLPQLGDHAKCDAIARVLRLGRRRAGDNDRRHGWRRRRRQLRL